MPMHVVARVNTDPTDGRALNLDAKFHFRLVGCRSLQEFVRVLDRVRMREKITYLQPDFAIIGMSGYRFGIIQPPRANRALLQRQLHHLSSVDRSNLRLVCGTSTFVWTARRPDAAARRPYPSNLIPVFCTSR